MSTFADSSALVKLYSSEAGHESIRALETVVVSALARVAVPSALWRKFRLNEITADQANVLVADFEADYFGTGDEDRRFTPVRITPQVLDSAAGLCASHGLRAYHSVQLASAIAARAAEPGCDQFAAFDSQLRMAAAVERFRLVPTDIER